MHIAAPVTALAAAATIRGPTSPPGPAVAELRVRDHTDGGLSFGGEVGVGVSMGVVGVVLIVGFITWFNKRRENKANANGGSPVGKMNSATPSSMTAHKGQSPAPMGGLQQPWPVPLQGYSGPAPPAPTGMFAGRQPQMPPNVQEMPSKIQQALADIQEMPPNMLQMPPNIQEMSPNIQQIPPTIQEMPANIQQIPPKIPPKIPEMPANIQQMTPNIQEMPANIQQMPPNIQEMPPNVQPQPIQLPHSPGYVAYVDLQTGQVAYYPKQVVPLQQQFGAPYPGAAGMAPAAGSHPSYQPPFNHNQQQQQQQEQQQSGFPVSTPSPEPQQQLQTPANATGTSSVSPVVPGNSP